MMRTVTVAAVLAAASLLACRSQQSLVVEEQSPIVAPAGLTAEALGVASPYGEFIEVIPQGAKVPCSAVRTFAPAHHRAPNRIEFEVLRGNAMDTRDAHALGRYWAPMPASERPSQIAVTFAIGADRKITASARDAASGKEVKLTRMP